MPVNGPREKLAADLELLKPVAGHVAYWSCGLIAGQSLTLGDLRALLAEPTPAPMSDIGMAISDALRQVGAALREVVALMRQSDGVIGFHLNGEVLAWSEFDLEDKIADALALLPALAQQMVEGEQRRVFLIDLQRRLDAVAPLIEQQRDDLVQTREALAVAEENLESAAISLASYDQSYGGGGGESEALDIARSLGFDGGSNECVEWLLDRCKLRAARIAALSPTGTPGAEGEPTV